MVCLGNDDVLALQEKAKCERLAYTFFLRVQQDFHLNFAEPAASTQGVGGHSG